MARRRFSPVDLELFNHRLAAVAEEMGALLQQAGFSPNIKERRDFSCAVFDSAGDLVSHAAHIPVHLGSSALSVREAIRRCPMAAGDIVMLNDPYAGGTHLPDLTVVAPVYLGTGKHPYAYIADRAHHADIGGHTPGSMGLSTDIYQEGLRIPPLHLRKAGRPVRETLELFLANTRVSEERLGDLDAQVAALGAGQARIEDLARRYGAAPLKRAMEELQAYSARLIRRLLSSLPAGRFVAEDFLDDDGAGSGPLRIAVAVECRRGRLLIDFTGTTAQVAGPVNANLAVTTSAVFYVVACLAGQEVPANRGMMDPIVLHAPEGSLVNCRFPAAVAGGNVETSQRIVDVLLKALATALPERIPAASCGTMTNLCLGGYDPFRRRFFSYYETVGGGAGGGPSGAGASALQTHMTNTRNTPVELLESYYPLRVTHYRLRRGSGGRGEQPGGDGIDREIEVLAAARLTLLADRRALGPYGLHGGATGRRGRDDLYHNGRGKRLPAKTNIELQAGQRVRVRTPGGGGWNRPPPGRR